MQKILIDENLSPSLASQAHARGFQCSHVNHLGKNGKKDWQLMPTIVEDGWTFVTNNSVDFRGSASRPGASGEYARVSLHAGLVCITAPYGLNVELQRQVFEFVLDDLEAGGDLTNQLLEVELSKNGAVTLRRTALPEEDIGLRS